MLINAGLRVLLTVPYSARDLITGSCLESGYYGIHGQNNVFITTESCLARTSHLFQTASVAPLVDDGRQLVWLGEDAVDASLKPAGVVDDFQAFLNGLPRVRRAETGEQTILTDSNEVLLVQRGIGHAVVSVSTEGSIESILPPFWTASPLPSEPVPFIPVPPKAVNRVKDILAGLKFDPTVASIVNDISATNLRRDVRYLTGEDSSSEIVSRHSFSKGVLIAADWLKENFERYGASCVLKKFLAGFAPNVVCTFAGSENTTETVLISAHYDSRGSFGSVRAPGGDDDGSGTTALLGIARVIYSRGITFRKNVQLVAFAGEEQGLYGSRYYSKELREKGANLTLMIQADMLGYHAAGEPPQLGLPDLIGTPEVTQLVANLSGIYSPELTVGFTPACCSDHQSFHEQGFPATQVFERAGPIADPMYHNSGDLSDREGYDFEQIRSIAKVQFATLLHSAGFDVKDEEE